MCKRWRLIFLGRPRRTLNLPFWAFSKLKDQKKGPHFWKLCPKNFLPVSLAILLPSLLCRPRQMPHAPRSFSAPVKINWYAFVFLLDVSPKLILMLHTSNEQSSITTNQCVGDELNSLHAIFSLYFNFGVIYRCSSGTCRNPDQILVYP